MDFKISKNAPCPCNSGLKYKKCCMENLTKEQERYYGLLQKENLIKEKLVGWAHNDFGEEELDKYAYEFDKKTFGELISKGDSLHFFDWFFMEAVDKEKGEKILNIIINEFPHLFEQEEIEIMKEWLNTQSGIFEVQDINEEDWKISIKEVFTNKEYEIRDRKASEYVVKGDIIFGRVQNVFLNCYLSGAVSTYPRFHVADQLKKFVGEKYENEKKKKPDLTYEEFMNSNSKILNDFIPEKPRFVTESDEDIKFCEAVYSVDLNHMDKILNWFEDNEDYVVTSVDYGKEFKSAQIVYVNKKNDNVGNNENRPKFRMMSHYINKKGEKIKSDGNVNIKGDNLKIFSMSEDVFRKITGDLKDNFDDYLKLECEDFKSADDVLEENEEGEDIEDEIDDEEFKKAMLEAFVPLNELVLEDNEKVKKIKTLFEKESEYADIFIAIEIPIKSYYDSNKNLKDSEVVKILKDIKENYDKKPEYFKEELAQMIMTMLSQALQSRKEGDKKLTKHELFLALDYVLWSIDNRGHLGQRGYVDWLKDFFGLSSEGRKEFEDDGDEEDIEDEFDDELKEKIGEKFFENYYKEWCDEKILALNNMTPREAIKTKEGKEQLKKLLFDFENMEEHKKRDGEKYFPAVDLIRKELGFWE